MLTRKELYNMFGWYTKRHLVVIESDDWGSLRMPSRAAYEEFMRRGIGVDNDPFCRYDRLATKHDLENLFDILLSVHDKYNRPVVMTVNTLTANPIFEKIAETNFLEYYYEPFTETLKRDADHADAFSLWEEGMKYGIFHPQSHGREHVNIKKWLKYLQQGHPVTKIAFDLGTWGLTQQTDCSIPEYYMGAFNSGLDADIVEYETFITDGLSLFEQIFGYRSQSFVPTTYEWSPKIEPCLKRNGVRYIQGEFAQKIPLDDDKTIKIQRRGFQGTKTKVGLIRLFRNCFFEPSVKPNYDWVGECLRRIEIAFKWHKAANICAHRLNFIGSIDPKNTDRNLPLFRQLLQEIVRRWPDVEFVSSDQLGKIIEESNQRLLTL